MLKISKRIVAMLLSILASFTLLIGSACEPIDSSDTSESSTKIELVYDKINNNVYAGEFSYSDLYIKITDPKGVSTKLTVTEDMLSEEDRNKLQTPGIHEISVTFARKELTITITLLKKSGSDKTDKITYNGEVPSGYYNGVDTLRAAKLKAKLREIISVVKKKETYNNLIKDLVKTDCPVGQEGKVLLFYSRKIVSGTWNPNTNWNREHVWPQSKGWFKTSGAGADLHHLRPENPSVNSSRGNKPFSDKNNSKYFTPDPEVRGDIARILFYLLVRYPESDSYNINCVAESMEMLLSWNESDPVDAWELQRNERTYEIQGNRNPFIDCEEFADMIWEEAA